MKQKLPVVMIALGAALLVFGLLTFNPARGGSDPETGVGGYSSGIEYPVASTVIAALGALGLAGGLALRGALH
jgi:hypothetical protein